jgi:hypothetical protein
MDSLSVALAVSLLNGGLGLTALFVTQADLTEAYSIAAALGFLVLYVLWRLEFKASYSFRTGNAPLNDKAATIDP